MAAAHPPVADAKAIQELATAYERLTEQISKVIVGQRAVVEQLLMALFSKRTLPARRRTGVGQDAARQSTVSRALDLSYKRVQFTPDLMPADITGTDILQDDPETGRRRFVFMPGPLFANMILADEINRTPPKTQAALLEAMQESRVTAGGETYKLPAPVLRARDPEPHRAGRDVPAARRRSRIDSCSTSASTTRPAARKSRS